MPKFGVTDLYWEIFLSAPKGTQISISQRKGDLKILTPGIDAEGSIYSQIIILVHIFIVMTFFHMSRNFDEQIYARQKKFCPANRIFRIFSYNLYFPKIVLLGINICHLGYFLKFGISRNFQVSTSLTKWLES